MIEGTVHATTIIGADYIDLKVIDTPGGAVLHMLRPALGLLGGQEGWMQVGEVYFSEVLPGAVKAWKRHARQTQHFAVPAGRLGIVLCDARESSLTRGAVQKLVLGRRDTYALLRIPCGVWYGFTALGDEPALISNVTDLPHDPEEGEKMDPDSDKAGAIPFSWKHPDFAC